MGIILIWEYGVILLFESEGILLAISLKGIIQSMGKRKKLLFANHKFLSIK